MKRQEILKVIRDLTTVNLDSLYQIFNVDSRNKRKRLEITLQELIDTGHIEYAENNKTFKLPEPKIKKEKRFNPNKITKKASRRSDYHPGNSVRDASQDFDLIIDKYEIRKDFPPSAVREAEEISNTIPESTLQSRYDLRNTMVVTIDGADAKDLDDAISIEKKQEIWRLGVHIADVSYYVPIGSKLDREAARRANSFYFINKVVPMFPKKLSNGICSLNPHEDRLTLSVFMDIDKSGNVIKYDIKETVIHSKHRLTYDWVQDFLDGKETSDDDALKKALVDMSELFRILNKKRIEGGAIDFDFKEQKCSLDENDEPVKLWLKERKDSERIIEEFMLIANQTIAKYLSEKGLSLYRVHGEPEAERIEDFIRVVMKLGHKIYGVPVPDTKELQRILEEVKDKPHKELVNQILLRSMQQARYHTDNIGHFGLGFEFYTHFTSPIRRFADLVIHRLVKHSLSGKKNQLYGEDELDRIADHISVMERTAMEAERELYKIKCIRFMKDFVGKKFNGIITGVTDFGIFVQIRKFGVEGLIRFADLDDYYTYDEKNFRATGKRNKKSFTMGDSLEIKVKRVSIAKNHLDLALVQDESPSEWN